MADDVSAVSATAPGAAGLLPMADAMASSTACSDTAGLATVRVPGRLFGRADRRMAPDGAAVGPGSRAAGRGAARLAAALARGAGRAASTACATASCTACCDGARTETGRRVGRASASWNTKPRSAWLSGALPACAVRRSRS
ncbi:hypothetical protein FHD67_06540 [Paracoccus haeundaensis]|uniref:Uncharacterized protein n=1 Tax=Paracoccus haeundaensis TaxID=225362 RepID=A0A5C4R8F8_9RHOB|nr:hypothetical protein FHD67_06540 [Paracoccus haeundaensis]